MLILAFGKGKNLYNHIWAHIAWGFSTSSFNQINERCGASHIVISGIIFG